MDTLKQIIAQLGIDDSFFWLFGMMWVLYALLSVTYLKPFQKLLHARKEKTEGTKKEAAELTARAEEKFGQYKERLKEITDEARREYRSREEAAKKEEAKILGDASHKAKTALQGAQRELDSQKKAVLETLSNDISGLATDIATKVLGRPVGSNHA
jgi:F0F1-type ATP synthase membrane subunit b/b'